LNRTIVEVIYPNRNQSNVYNTNKYYPNNKYSENKTKINSVKIENKNNNTDNNNQQKQNKNINFDGACYKCGEHGHIARYCTKISNTIKNEQNNTTANVNNINNNKNYKNIKNNKNYRNQNKNVKFNQNTMQDVHKDHVKDAIKRINTVTIGNNNNINKYGRNNSFSDEDSFGMDMFNGVRAAHINSTRASKKRKQDNDNNVDTNTEDYDEDTMS
jgi:hypothetical protein